MENVSNLDKKDNFLSESEEEDLIKVKKQQINLTKEEEMLLGKQERQMKVKAKEVIRAVTSRKPVRKESNAEKEAKIK